MSKCYYAFVTVLDKTAVNGWSGYVDREGRISEAPPGDDTEAEGHESAQEAAAAIGRCRREDGGEIVSVKIYREGEFAR